MNTGFAGKKEKKE